MVSSHGLAPEDIAELERLLAISRRYPCPLMGAYITLLQSDPALQTQQQLADYIGSCLGVAITRHKISDWVNGHKAMPRALQDLARRELLEGLLTDDRSLQLVELLGLRLSR